MEVCRREGVEVGVYSWHPNYDTRAGGLPIGIDGRGEWVTFYSAAAESRVH